MGVAGSSVGMPGPAGGPAATGGNSPKPNGSGSDAHGSGTGVPLFVMERVDGQGHIIGFGVMGVSRFKKDKPLEADLSAA